MVLLVRFMICVFLEWLNGQIRMCGEMYFSHYWYNSFVFDLIGLGASGSRVCSRKGRVRRWIG